MIVLHDPSEVPSNFGASVVAIGKFDGVHAGHRAVIDRARVDAATGGARVVAVTFDRNPLSILRPEVCPADLIGVHKRSAERRVGKACVSTCRSRGSTYH